MAKVIGRSGVIKVGANTVAEVINFSMARNMSPIDASNLGDQNLEYVAGDITGTVDLTCHWDKADTTGQGAVSIGSSVTLVLQPEGDTTGDQTQTMTALCTSDGLTVERGSMVQKAFQFTISGDVTEGSVA